MQNLLAPTLVQAVQADIARDARAPRGRRRPLLRRRRPRRTTSLVPAPVRVDRPATW